METSTLTVARIPTGGTSAPPTRPEAPVFVVGRRRPYLDVRWLVEDAEAHLLEDFASGALAVSDTACFDRRGRPLDIVVGADSTVRLTTAPAAADPEALRDRLAAVCAAARRAHPDVAPELQCDPGQLELPAGDVPELALEMAARFGHVRTRPAADGEPGDVAAHSGGRLHNFWHAIS